MISHANGSQFVWAVLHTVFPLPAGRFRTLARFLQSGCWRGGKLCLLSGCIRERRLWAIGELWCSKWDQRVKASLLESVKRSFWWQKENKACDEAGPPPNAKPQENRLFRLCRFNCCRPKWLVTFFVTECTNNLSAITGFERNES